MQSSPAWPTMNLRASGNFDHIVAKQISDFSKDVADKFESQEKEIDYLKKNALALINQSDQEKLQNITGVEADSGE